jgi:hypothetical protein
MGASKYYFRLERGMKFVLLVLLCVGWSTFWSRNYAFHSMPGEMTRPDTEAQQVWRSGTLSPKAMAILESKSKGPDLALANNWSFSEESRSRVNEISLHYSLSPDNQKRSDESNRRRAEIIGLVKKPAYLPRN